MARQKPLEMVKYLKNDKMRFIRDIISLILGEKLLLGVLRTEEPTYPLDGVADTRPLEDTW